ncbi:hypothetical protein KKG82_06270 [Patescibacteria group bacterium]|nr:hypothetical protein [Nanoarchaeota archaeon]MBU1901938.1 hypothetical protein [Patescibacteria group bacterium]
MVEINWLGGLVLGINVLLTFLLQGMKNVGIKRSAAISGWISLLLGALILVIQKGITFISSTLALVFGLVVVFAILFIILPALMPHANMSFMKHPIKFFMTMGYFIGYIMAIILAFL